MNVSYNYAIKMGVIVGVLFAIISCLNITLHISDFVYSSLSSIKPLFYVFLLLADLLILLILGELGYQVVRHYRNLIHNYKDAIILSAMAGGIAGIINGTAQLIVGLIIPGIISCTEGGFSGHDALLLISSFIDIAIYVFMGGIIISVIGGLIYMVKNTKIRL